GPEQEHVARLVGEVGVEDVGIHREGGDPAAGEGGGAGLQVGMDGDRRPIAVVHARPAQLGVVEGVSQRLDQVEPTSRHRRQPHGVSGVGRDLGVIEDDVEHTQPRPARMRRAMASARTDFFRSSRSWDSLGAWTEDFGSPAPTRTIGACGIFSEKAATNGMDPPTPISTGSRPQARRMPSRHASTAGPSVDRAKPRPASAGVTVTCAPQGACAFRWFVRASIAASGSWAGGIRMLTLARATGTSWLIASERGGASTARTAMAGLVHIRDTRD